MDRIIWQYWETKGTKPPFIDGLLDIARRNSGAKVIQVTPESLGDYLPSIPPELHRIGELAHKADMIRSMLVHEHGGMWLDSDAIVLSDLGWLFSELDNHEFVGFTRTGLLAEDAMDIRISCFLARRQSAILKEWIQAQHAKFPRTEYRWREVGTDLLGPIALAHRQVIKVLPYDLICPVTHSRVKEFSSLFSDSRPVLEKAKIVMLNNKALHKKRSPVLGKSVEELCAGNDLIADILRKALDPGYVPPTPWTRVKRAIFGR